MNDKVVLTAFLFESGRTRRIVVRQPEAPAFEFLPMSASLQSAERWRGAEWACGAVFQYDYRVVSEELWPQLISGESLSDYAVSYNELPKLIYAIDADVSKGKASSFTRAEFVAIVNRAREAPKTSDGAQLVRISAGKKFVVADPLYGEIRLTEAECELLDSRPLQRLRNCVVHSTAHFVWPGMHHTLFEHSLGRLYMVDRLLMAMDHQSRSMIESSARRSYEEVVRIARLAALVHDVGHIPFRPVRMVTEKLAILVDKFADLEIRWLTRLLGIGTFAKLVSACLQTIAASFAAADLIRVLRREDEQLYWLSDMLSGPVSADRIDYLLRDALYSGQALTFDASRVPRALSVKRDINKRGEDCLNLMASGRESAALEWYILSSCLMYERVYLHPTLRALQSHWDRFASSLHSDITNEDRFFEIDSGFVLQRAKDSQGVHPDARAIVTRRIFKYTHSSAWFLRQETRDELFDAAMGVFSDEEEESTIDTEVFPIRPELGVTARGQVAATIQSTINAVRVFSFSRRAMSRVNEYFRKAAG